MPRMPLISTLEKPDNARTFDTRISAHTRPRRVATTSAHAKTSTVTSAPFASSGRYSARSLRVSTAGQREAAPAYLSPQFARILSIVPSAFILRNDALTLSSIALSPLRTAMPTLPTSIDL